MAGINLRVYRESDFEGCEALVGQVWDFAAGFNSAQSADLMREFYTGFSLAGSDYQRVLTENGRVQGFLFGRVKHNRPQKTNFSGLTGFLRYIRGVFMLPGIKRGRKLKYIFMVLIHEKRRALIRLGEDAVVNLFVVSPTLQGKGLGKILMNDFFVYCRNQGARKIALETDNASNLGFYEHLGFIREGSFDSPMQALFTDGPGLTFLYVYKI